MKRCRELADVARTTRCQWDERTAARIADKRWAVPVPGSRPLFRVKRLSDGETVTTTDAYIFAEHQKAANPFKKGDALYDQFEGLRLLRPYATASLSLWEFLGFVKNSGE